MTILAWLKQYALNWLIALDKGVNTVLAGNPNETLSYRFARCRDEGQKWAVYVCMALNILSKNHCTAVETPGSLGKELWHWSGKDIPHDDA